MKSEPLFYTLDYMLAQTREWRRDMEVRRDNDPADKWASICWRDLNSLEASLARAVEAEGS